MLNTIDAVYENGVLKPVKQLNIPEHKLVHLIIQETVSVAAATSGMIPARDSKTVEIIALDPAFLPEEA